MKKLLIKIKEIRPIKEKGDRFYELEVYVDPKVSKFQIKHFFENEDYFGSKIKKVYKINTIRKKPVLRRSLLRRFPGKSYTKLKKKAFIKFELASSQKFLNLFEEQIKEVKKIKGN